MSKVKALVDEFINILIHKNDVRVPANIHVWVRPCNVDEFRDKLVKRLIEHLNLKDVYFPFDEPEKKLLQINQRHMGYDSFTIYKVSPVGPVLWVGTQGQTDTLIDMDTK